MNYIPIVDLIEISSKNERVPSKENWLTVAKQIDRALSTVGFAYLINHEVKAEKISRAFAKGKHFFELPLEIKEKYAKDSTKTYHGYSKPGQELLNAEMNYELRESYDFCGNERYYPTEDSPEFESANTELENECRPLIYKLLKIIALSLKAEEDFFINCSKYMDDPSIPTYSAFRSIYYPVVDETVPPGAVRCAEHTDYGILTLLFQDSIGGLEIKTVDGNWAPANPLSGSILINTGDLLEFWSNGHFPATKHRVFIPEEEIKKKVPRQSIVYFYHPDNSTIVIPFNKINGPGIEKSNKEYTPVSAGEHAQRKLDNTYQY